MPRQTTEQMRSHLAVAAVGLSAIGFGTVPFFAKSLTDAGMASVSVAFYRYLIGAVVLVPFLRLGLRDRASTTWALIAGAAMGIGWSGYVKSIQFLPVSTAAIIYMTYPAFTVAVSWLFFRQEIRASSVVASMLIALAAALAITPSGSWGWNLQGLAYAFAAPLTFGVAVNILAMKLDAIPPFSRIAGLGLGATIGLIPLVVSLSPDQVLPGSTAALWMILGICLITALGPQLLYVVYSPRIGSAKSAMLGGLELPTMVLIGWFVFGEPKLATQIAAAILVVAAITLTRNKDAR